MDAGGCVFAAAPSSSLVCSFIDCRSSVLFTQLKLFFLVERPESAWCSVGKAE